MTPLTNNKKYILLLLVYSFLTFYFMNQVKNITNITSCSYYFNFIILSLWFGILVKSIFIYKNVSQNKEINIYEELKQSSFIIIGFALLFSLVASFVYFLVHSSYTLTLFNSLYYLTSIIFIGYGIYYIYNKFFGTINFSSFSSFSPLSLLQNSSLFTKYLLFIELLLIVSYFFIPYFRRLHFLKNGKLLLEKSAYLNKKQQISSDEELINNNQFNYNYSLSMWFFFNERFPNVNENYNKYTEIFNYGFKPQILYNSKNNKLKVVMKQGKEKSEVMYNNIVPLQMWNNVVINYDRGTLDVFINGKLVSTEKNVVPYMKYDNISVGSDNSIDSGVASVVYYDSILSVQDIVDNYKSLKNNPII